jgi:hypothetical protein
MTLKAEEFIRRFLLHVLPKGFVRVRHFGFLANRCRRDNVVLCCKLLAASSTVLPDLAPPPRHSVEPETDTVGRCPRCKVGSMRMLEILLPQAGVMAAPGAVQLDTRRRSFSLAIEGGCIGSKVRAHQPAHGSAWRSLIPSTMNLMRRLFSLRTLITLPRVYLNGPGPTLQ